MKHDFPVNILCWGNLDAGSTVIDRHPDTRFIIDHLGILQPRTPPAPPEPWADLPKVLDLARRKNVVIKVSGACTLSKKPYPFPDIWDPLARVFDAWGFDRCLWGTDWTRAYAVVNYEQAVEPFLKTDRLSDERASDADGRRLCQSLSLVANESLSQRVGHKSVVSLPNSHDQNREEVTMLFMLVSRPKAGATRQQLVEHLTRRLDPATWDLIRQGILSHVLYKVGDEPGFFAVLNAPSVEEAKAMVDSGAQRLEVFDLQIVPVNQFPHFG